MQPTALRALEFDRVVEMVRTFAMTPMGDERISRLAPSPDPQKVAQLLAATTETAKYLAANGLFPLRSASVYESSGRGSEGRSNRISAAKRQPSTSRIRSSPSGTAAMSSW